MKLTLFILILMAIFSSCAVADEWYAGGTLHQATVLQWKSASPDNRLATSADWFTLLTKRFNQSLQKEMDSLNNDQYLSFLKYNSRRLEQCVSQRAGSQYANGSGRIVDYAVTCYKNLFGL